MIIIEQLQECIDTGKGMTAKTPGLDFTIYPRSIPYESLPAVPESVPLLRDFKKTGGNQRDWNILRACYDEQYGLYYQAVIKQRYERAIVARLYRIKSMLINQNRS